MCGGYVFLQLRQLQVHRRPLGVKRFLGTQALQSFSFLSQYVFGLIWWRLLVFSGRSLAFFDSPPPPYLLVSADGPPAFSIEVSISRANFQVGLEQLFLRVAGFSAFHSVNKAVLSIFSHPAIVYRGVVGVVYGRSHGVDTAGFAIYKAARVSPRKVSSELIIDVGRGG